VTGYRIKVTRTLVVGWMVWASLAAQEGTAPAKQPPAPKILSEAELETKPKPPSPKAKAKAAAAAKAKAAANARALDLNRATRSELKRLPGLTDAQVGAILAGRPYRTKAELVTKGILPMDLYQALRGQVAVKPGTPNRD
jgi:competence protein ComEA